MTVEFVTLDTEEGVSLKVRIFRPDEGNAVKEMVIVLVHQYTLLGGCQGLLKGMASEIAEKGYICVTFDMRGAGRSTGRASLLAMVEVEDVVAVCKWATVRLNTSSIVLVGSSVGATIAGSALEEVEQIKGYVALGYPFGFWGWLFFGHHKRAVLKSEKPKLFVMGTRDGFTSVKQFVKALKTASGRVKTHLIPNIGHFEMERPRYDATLAQIIASFGKTLE
ncbi:hypothetical protein O6H91_14G007500 [Diphasiastrum complanatum]|uniref:Uncharacterized protein n=1 Tax=Diphasiastrum complanatum TaxID=34168 RepID=A0ACC2BLA0_DIPCM|nr:hypothetical protein O6H91_14G007500 [Diphasiastrum complanatum]